MIEKASEFQVRRVIHGTGPDGRSVLIEDVTAPTRIETPAFTIVDLWRFNQLPPVIGDNQDGLAGVVELTPPAGVAAFRISAIAPDEDWAGSDYAESLGAIGHEDEAAADSGAGESAHATDTIDIALITSGEVYCTTDTGEVLLKAGDVLVQNGNTHGWSNRSGKVAIVAWFMVGGTRG